MVVLDSDQSEAHVLGELQAFAGLVSLGCYLIVEDTDINGHPVFHNFGPGPMEAVDGLTPNHPEFERTSLHERYLVSASPGGYLRRRYETSQASRGVSTIRSVMPHLLNLTRLKRAVVQHELIQRPVRLIARTTLTSRRVVPGAVTVVTLNWTSQTSIGVAPSSSR
jgi:hypothetical protein